MKENERFESLESVQQMLRHLYLRQKKENPAFSLQYLCRRAGLSSKGYLSDVMSGRRRLQIEHARKLAQIFALEGFEKNIFLKTAQKESEKSPSRRKVLEKQLLSIKAQSKAGKFDFPTEVRDRVLFTRVFCAIGLFAQPPTPAMVRRLFPDQANGTIDQVIAQLISTGSISEASGTLRLGAPEIMFGAGADNQTNIALIRDLIGFAGSQLDKWYPKREESYFSSAILSVRRSEFIQALPRLREFFEAIQTELETTTGADELVHFNLQVFPDGLGA